METTDYEESLRSTVRLARLSFSAGAASIFVYDESRDTLVFEAASGAGEDQIIGMRVPATHGIVGWVASTGEPILVRDVSTDARFELETAVKTGYVPQIIMASPLLRRNEIIGVMEILDPDLSKTGDIEALDLLSELAGQAAMLLSMVPRMRSRSSAVRAEVEARLDAVLDRVPDNLLNELSRLIDALTAMIA